LKIEKPPLRNQLIPNKMLCNSLFFQSDMLDVVKCAQTCLIAEHKRKAMEILKQFNIDQLFLGLGNMESPQ